MNKEDATVLGPYRVLDLTEGGCLLCGKMLGDLGADVIKIERPGGSPSRNIGPFYRDISDPEKSLSWFAYNINKRSITLNIDCIDGREILKMLIRKADFLIESFEPGYLDALGLGYASLSKVNPRIIVTSITPFGQTGPKSKYKASDLVSWASGGALYISGAPDNTPTGMGYQQAELNGAAEASVGTLIAHVNRESIGEGQHVDVSIQESVIWLIWTAAQHWDLSKRIIERTGFALERVSGIKERYIYPCKDGWVSCVTIGGGAGSAFSRRLVEWMDEEGMAPDWLKTLDWVSGYSAQELLKHPELVDRTEESIGKFLLTKTKSELLEQAIKRKLMLAPIWNIKEVYESPQLLCREFSQLIKHPELNDAIPYCGSFVKFSEVGGRVSHRPPRIGEHNEDIYMGELNFPKEKLVLLKEANVI